MRPTPAMSLSIRGSSENAVYAVAPAIAKITMTASAVGERDSETAARGIGRVALSSASAIPRRLAKGMTMSQGIAPTKLTSAHVARDRRQPKASAIHTPATVGAVALMAMAVA
ncbi:unannotated protein [freshwater metagenome]|uniref:Unannotated protein n=1 Tax=freshwater metagenome TaxID=449393 RepID=A0A6J6JZC0_9ZZZZ